MDAKGIKREAAGGTISPESLVRNSERIFLDWIFYCSGPAGTWTHRSSAAELASLRRHTSLFARLAILHAPVGLGRDFLDGEGTAWSMTEMTHAGMTDGITGHSFRVRTRIVFGALWISWGSTLVLIRVTLHRTDTAVSWRHVMAGYSATLLHSTY